MARAGAGWWLGGQPPPELPIADPNSSLLQGITVERVARSCKGSFPLPSVARASSPCPTPPTALQCSEV